jgi:hypothetical protein
VRVAPGELAHVDDLELERHAQLGRETRRRGPAERLQGALDPPLVVGRELRRAREVDRAHAPLAPAIGVRILGQPPFLRRLDERGDGVR